MPRFSNNKFTGSKTPGKFTGKLEIWNVSLGVSARGAQRAARRGLAARSPSVPRGWQWIKSCVTCRPNSRCAWRSTATRLRRQLLCGRRQARCFLPLCCSRVRAAIILTCVPAYTSRNKCGGTVRTQCASMSNNPHGHSMRVGVYRPSAQPSAASDHSTAQRHLRPSAVCTMACPVRP